ncbi:MAG: glycosyltransferase [Anaerolineae bacterium]|nr:glycosyltransferase [Gloeobacterales cyanobacterium ES-bin-313]
METLFWIFALFVALEQSWKYWAIDDFFRRADQENRATDPAVSISIVQPILSGDPTLWDCLSANLMMKTTYQIEFIWCIDDEDEQALIGCQALIAKHPEVSVRLLSLPPSPAEISPKTFKLMAGIEMAKGEVIVCLDDDTMLPDESLETSIPQLYQQNVGAVFGLPYYVNFSNIWSALVSCVVNGNSLLTYIPYTYVVEPFTINGMFFTIRRDIFENVNGFRGIEAEICDDYAIARRLRSYGYKLVQTSVCHGISTQVQDGNQYINLLNRWFIFPQASILQAASLKELVSFYVLAFLPTLFPLFLLSYLIFNPSSLVALYGVGYLCLNALMLFRFNTVYLKSATPTSYYPLLAVMQVLLPFHILLSLVMPRKINWRGHVMEIRDDGTFDLIQRRASGKEP